MAILIWHDREIRVSREQTCTNTHSSATIGTDSKAEGDLSIWTHRISHIDDDYLHDCHTAIDKHDLWINRRCLPGPIEALSLAYSVGHLPFEHLLVWAACPFEQLYCWATFNCAIKMPNTIACLTGYPQDMCVAIATHGPQACTLSLCSVPAASRRRVLIKSCSTVQMLNDTHESAQQYTKTAQTVISG